VEISRLLAPIPKQYHPKCIQLYEYLQSDPSIVHASENGRLVVDGKVVHGSSYIDAIRALYQNLRGVEANVIGVPQLLKAMNKLGVPSSLISSSVVRSQYTLQKKESLEDASIAATSKQQTGRGVPPVLVVHTKTKKGKSPSAVLGDGFPGRPVKCLRLY
jgi:hypothetical protein